MKWLNQENEEAVKAFLEKKISYLDIVTTCQDVLENMPKTNFNSIDEVFHIDQQARQHAQKVIHKKISS